MVEPRKAQRSARAWACWWMACHIFPDYPADEKQLREEGVLEPAKDDIIRMLERDALPGESILWERILPEAIFPLIPAQSTRSPK